MITNILAYRIKTLADKNHRSFNEQLLLMIETFEVMNIKKLSYLPAQPGCNSVPVVEVSGTVIQGG